MSSLFLLKNYYFYICVSKYNVFEINNILSLKINQCFFEIVKTKKKYFSKILILIVLNLVCQSSLALKWKFKNRKNYIHLYSKITSFKLWFWFLKFTHIFLPLLENKLIFIRSKNLNKVVCIKLTEMLLLYELDFIFEFNYAYVVFMKSYIIYISFFLNNYAKKSIKLIYLMFQFLRLPFFNI